MKQDLFAFDDTPAPVSTPVEEDQGDHKWNWWDPWPSHWTQRQCYMRQISRDRRALEECEPEERRFYAERIVAYRKAIMEMDGAGSPQQATSAVPGGE